MRTIAIALALAAMTAGGARGQEPKPTGVLRGVVTGDAGPIAGAEVKVFGREEPVATDLEGRFRFEGLEPGGHWLYVRAIGYEPVTKSVTIIAHQERSLTVALEVATVVLPEIQVSGGMTDWRYFDFQWRRRGSFGRFYTRDDIGRLNPFDLVDLVQRGLPFTTRYELEQRSWIAPTARGFAASWNSNPGFCTPAISLNGTRPWPGASLRDFSLEEIEALEIYRSRYVPVQLGPAPCGLVVLWLR